MLVGSILTKCTDGRQFTDCANACAATCQTADDDGKRACASHAGKIGGYVD
jgi:hypothetical protein